MATPVEKHGGEMLKFMGDGMLAIFPPRPSPEACNRALQAARRGARAACARSTPAASSAARSSSGFGLALHVGDVMYGNIGTATRLDFTVIGPAVNVTSRIESADQGAAPPGAALGAIRAEMRLQRRVPDHARPFPAARRRRTARGLRPQRGGVMQAGGRGRRARKLKDLEGPARRHACDARSADRCGNRCRRQSGQYAMRLRAAGWRQADPLDRAACPRSTAAWPSGPRADPAWEVAPPMAMGAPHGRGPCWRCRRERHELAAGADGPAAGDLAHLARRCGGSGAAAAAGRAGLVRTGHGGGCSSSSTSRVPSPRCSTGMSGLWPRIQGLQLELALLPLYEGERPGWSCVDDLAERGFAPYLLFPGYFSSRAGARRSSSTACSTGSEPSQCWIG